MKFSNLTLAIATTLGASASFSAFAIDLYVDTKTKQIYAEPGRGRVLMGSFEQVGGSAPAKTAAPAPAAVPAEIDAMKQDLELKTNEIKALQEHAAEATKPDSVIVKLDDGIQFKTRDGNFSAAINGRMQVDSQVNVTDQVNDPNPFTNASSTTNKLDDGVGIRRARLGVEGTFFKDTDYKFEYDFTRGNGTTGAGVTDAFIRYNFSKPFSVRAGAFKEPFGLEEATSNRYISFIERNMISNTFIDNLNTYKVGLGANYAEERWQVATSLQTEPVGNNGASNSATYTTPTGSTVNPNGGSNRSNGSGDTNYEINLRASGLPWMESKTKFLHVGASGSYVNVNNNYQAGGAFNNGGISFASNPDTNVDRTNTLNTSNLSFIPIVNGIPDYNNAREADHFWRFGAETALTYGPFSAQAEYIQANIDGKGYNGNTLNGGYAYMTYFLTGESRAWRPQTASWGRIKPNRNFDMKGGWGAWEVATGYDAIDLNSGVIQAGKQSTFKVGLNWYPNSHLRIMANYIHLLDLDTGGYKVGTRERAFNDANLDIIETRVQIDW
jgi:phosphate-selective porin OprO and OprP